MSPCQTICLHVVHAGGLDALLDAAGRAEEVVPPKRGAVVDRMPPPQVRLNPADPPPAVERGGGCNLALFLRMTRILMKAWTLQSMDAYILASRRPTHPRLYTLLLLLQNASVYTYDHID